MTFNRKMHLNNSQSVDFPPLKKGGRGDLREAEDTHLLKIPFNPPFAKGGSGV